MKTSIKDPANYVDHGHPGVWPNGELPAMRVKYDELLAEQNANRKKPQAGSR